MLNQSQKCSMNWLCNMREGEGVKMTHIYFFYFGSCMNDDVIIGMRTACWLKWEYVYRILVIKSFV